MMKGWKTWVAAIGLCLLGMAMIVLGIRATALQEVLFGLGTQAILFGFGLVGLGSKIERRISASDVSIPLETAERDRRFDVQPRCPDQPE